MKIAIVSDCRREVSPAAPNGVSNFCFNLAQGLSTDKDIESVDVYGIGISRFVDPKIRFISLLPTDIDTYFHDNPSLFKHNANLPEAYIKLQFALFVKAIKQIARNEYDIVHDNSTSPVFASLSKSLGIFASITTMHTVPQTFSVVLPRSVDIIEKDHPFVAISAYQQQLAKEEGIDVNFVQTVYNGVDIETYTPSYETKQTDPFLWVGRINPSDNKGLKDALQVAALTGGDRMTIFGAIDDRVFFDEEIQPLITPKVSFSDTVLSVKQKREHYGNSAALLEPIRWNEPFGLMFIEAMACGTPVIAYARGAAPEIVKDGVTGYLVNESNGHKRGNWIVKQTGQSGLREAINLLKSMSSEQYTQMRKNARSHVESNFSLAQMVANYKSVYLQVITSHK